LIDLLGCKTLYLFRNQTHIFPKTGPNALKFGFICFTKTPEASSKRTISFTFTSAFMGQKRLVLFDPRQVLESLPFVMVDVP
jgi:hypothetical protein